MMCANNSKEYRNPTSQNRKAFRVRSSGTIDACMQLRSNPEWNACVRQKREASAWIPARQNADRQPETSGGARERSRINASF